jgi:hypothetical protein
MVNMTIIKEKSWDVYEIDRWMYFRQIEYLDKREKKKGERMDYFHIYWRARFLDNLNRN